MGCAIKKSKAKISHFVYKQHKQKKPDISKLTFQKVFITSRSYIKKNNLDFFDVYTIEELIGNGGFGEVFKVLHIEHNLRRAMKRISKQPIVISGRKAEFLSEIEVLTQIDHPHIVRIYEYFEDNAFLYIITEYVPGGELLEFITQSTEFSEDKARHIFKQLLSAVNYLHSLNIVHRDLKPENILVEEVGIKARDGFLTVKLIDFGTCSYFSNEQALSLKIGTPYYIAPEVIDGNYTASCDVWSCGVILYVLLLGYHPFRGENSKEILEKVKTGKYDTTGEEWDSLSENAKDLIGKMLEYEPSKRITVKDALEHDLCASNVFSTTDTSIKRTLTNIKKVFQREKLQQATLAYIVHMFFDSKEIAELRRVFEQLDLNKDGRLTYDELRRGYMNYFDGEIDKENLEKLISEIDYDGNGFIEYEEFLRVSLNERTLVKESYLERAFKFFDENNDGKLSVQELERAIGTEDENYVKSLIFEVDRDLDGQISYEEFKTLMRTVLLNTIRKKEIEVTKN